METIHRKTSRKAQVPMGRWCQERLENDETYKMGGGGGEREGGGVVYVLYWLLTWLQAGWSQFTGPFIAMVRYCSLHHTDKTSFGALAAS